MGVYAGEMRLSFSSLFRFAVRGLVFSLIDVHDDHGGVPPDIRVISVVVNDGARTPPGPVVGDVMCVHGVVESVVVMPVMGPPGLPVHGIVPVAPGRTPYYVSRTVDIPYNRPDSHFIIGGRNHPGPGMSACITGISRIRPFGIDGFDDVVLSIQGLIADQLDQHGAIPEFFDHENGHILVFLFIEGHSKYDIVDILFCKVEDHDVIYIAVAIQVKVIDHLFRIVQAFFKDFKGFRFLEEVHHGIEVQVVPRQAKVFPFCGLCHEHAAPCEQERDH